jgi:hypothetical protein
VSRLGADSVSSGPAGIGGRILAVATGALAGVRPAPKPLHPYGELRRARVRRYGSVRRSGVPFIDEAGSDDAVVRISRAIGLPPPLPDIFGLALRVGTGATAADLLLASTGRRGPARFVLTVGRHAGSRPMTTLLPYRSASGPLLLGARIHSLDHVTLDWSHGLGPWHGFASIELGELIQGEDISFDPVQHTCPGLQQYRWARALREPAYRRARASRGG